MLRIEWCHYDACLEMLLSEHMVTTGVRTKARVPNFLPSFLGIGKGVHKSSRRTQYKSLLIATYVAE
jgi:hypothetical protein